MDSFVKVKKAFTLIELMLVIILISAVSFLALSNFNFNTEREYKITLENIKEFMINNFTFEKSLSLTCYEEKGLECYIFVDGKINKNIEIKNLFTQIPTVYNYDKELSDYRFSRIRIDNEEYEPFFELIINSDKKHKNIVVDTNDEKVYLFSSLSKKAELFENTNELIERFYQLESEVKDAL